MNQYKTQKRKQIVTNDGKTPIYLDVHICSMISQIAKYHNMGLSEFIETVLEKEIEEYGPQKPIELSWKQLEILGINAPDKK